MTWNAFSSGELIDTVFDGNHATEKAFDLLGHIEMVEYRLLAFVELYDFGLLRCDGLDVFPYLFIERSVIHPNVGERFVKQVAEHDTGLVHLADHPSEGGHLLHLDGALLPFGDERAQVGIEFSHLLAFGDSTDDDAVVVGLDALDEPTQAIAFVAAADLLRYRNAVGEGNQDKVTTCKRNLCSDSGAFGVDRFLGDLDGNHVVTHVEYVANLAVFREVRLKLELIHGDLFVFHDFFLVLEQGMGLQAQVEIVKESLFGITHVDKSRVKAWQDFLHSTQIDVTDRKLVVGLLSVKFYKDVVFQ